MLFDYEAGARSLLMLLRYGLYSLQWVVDHLLFRQYVGWVRIWIHWMFSCTWYCWYHWLRSLLWELRHHINLDVAIYLPFLFSYTYLLNREFGYLELKKLYLTLLYLFWRSILDLSQHPLALFHHIGVILYELGFRSSRTIFLLGLDFLLNNFNSPFN
jgi:hypothetical protein